MYKRQEYAYNSQDQLVRLTDYLSGNTTEYTYDLLGRLTGSRTNGNNDVRAEYSYDKYNRWTGQTNITSGGSHAYGVEYGEDNLEMCIRDSYTTVAIYANDTGEKFVLTKTFSNHSASYLNTGWGWSGYDPSKTMEDYSKLTAYYKNF